MSYLHIFIDESGDPGLRGSNHLILSCLIVKDEKKLKRIIKNMRRNKFRKELKGAQEIKANKSSEELRKYMLKKLNSVKDAKIFYIVLEKNKIYSDFLKENKHKLYNFVAGKLAKNMILDCSTTDIKIDRSKGKQILQEDFNGYFKSCLRERSKIDKINISHSYSHNWSGLQFADILAWSCFQKFEHGKSEYLDILELEQEVLSMWK